MASTWAKNLTLVKVPQGDHPKPITLVLPYYDNPQFLRQQLGWWATYPPHLLDQMSIVIVDDGSPVSPALNALEGQMIPERLRLFRIHEDRRWNWLAARNIGAHVADEGWLVLTDMDHVVSQPTLDSLIYGHHNPEVIYGFSRIEHTGLAINPHPNSFFMTREMFWRVGGYDETLSGHYGTDGDWRRRCAKTAPIQILTDRLIRHEHSGDSSTTRYLRKQPEDAIVQTLIASRRANWQPKTLSFTFEEIALAQEVAQ